MDCQPQPSLLSLPQPIRQRIYLEAGLTVESSIDLNRRIHEEKLIKERHPRVITRCAQNPHACTHNLLLTCRLIYAEASALVYSRNRFFIRYKDSKSLKTLTNLNETSLACLTYLSIHLRVTSCEYRELRGACCVAGSRTTTCTREHRQRDEHGEHDGPMGNSSQDKSVLLEWQSAARHVATYINPSSLNLQLVCDVDDLEIARLAIQPIQSFPLLEDCSIRLNQTHHLHLQALAVEAATKAVGLHSLPENDGSPFRFLDLPVELRLRILEYTDLITPLNEVEWNPKDNYYLRYAWYCPRGGYRYGHVEECSASEHHSCQFRNCWERSTGCFCQRYHTAFSSECRCWLPPAPLFLVCKAFRKDAEYVFFTKNHFVIAPEAGCLRPIQKSPERLEAWIFFQSVLPKTALPFLRSLEIVFPPFFGDYLMRHEPVYKQWLEVIDHMCHLNLPMLSLAVAMAEPLLRYDHTIYPDVQQYRDPMSDQQARKICKMYARTIQPLSKLGENGLQAFFLSLASPYTWDIEYDYNFRQRQDDLLLRFTRDSEQYVMGEDYDSSLLQKKVRGQSQWLREKEVGDQLNG